ncbi:MAG: N-formylglutamate amidohydrolase [Bacteriovoracaceae bacterium]
MKEKIFSFYTPHDLPLKGVLSMPHSGEWIPDEFRPHLTMHQRDLDQDLDYRVNELVEIEKLCEMGIAVVVSHIHRTCVDINRSAQTAVFAWTENTQGTILVHTPPTASFIEKAIGRYHAPYFELLTGIIDEGSKNRTKPLPVIDLHSMPSCPTEYHLKKNPQQKIDRADFCLSDLRGTSCDSQYLKMAQDLFSQDHTVSVNDPYFGGYVTQFFHTFPALNALQIEINRKLYMDEQHIVMKLDQAALLKKFVTQNLLNIFQNSQ